MTACLWCPGSLAPAGKLLRCACGGAWIDEAELSGFLAELDLPWAPRAGEPRPCLVCSKAMATVTLEAIALDRCDRHGIWFDPGELALVLQHAEHADRDEVIPESMRDGAHASTAVATDDAVLLSDPATRADFDDTFLVGHTPERFLPPHRRALVRLGDLLLQMLNAP